MSLFPQRRFYAATQRDQPLTVPLLGVKVSAGAPHTYQDVHVCVGAGEGFCSDYELEFELNLPFEFNLTNYAYLFPEMHNTTFFKPSRYVQKKF